MATYNGDNWTFTIEEWWDSDGDYHKGEPTTSGLDDAFQLTGHFHDNETGEDRYTTMFSGDTPEDSIGWEWDELYAEIEEWYEEGSV